MQVQRVVQVQKMSENGWNRLGWQGISFLKPKEWELGRVEGDEERGYLRLDDHLFNRMELRWQKQVRLSLEKVLARYVRGLRKTARKRRVDFRIMNERNYQTKTIKGKYFMYSNTVNLVAHCEKSSRLLMACVFGKRGEHIEKKAEKIFRSLRNRTGDDETLWAVFDFGFTTPCELKLSKHSFLSGHLRLDFLRGEDSFIFEQLSIANILLKGKSLSQWAREFCRSQFRNVDIEVGYPREGSSEEGIYTVGREHGKVRFIKKRFFRSFFWHCQRTNHIFGVAELVRKKDEACLDKLVSGVKCH